MRQRCILIQHCCIMRNASFPLFGLDHLDKQDRLLLATDDFREQLDKTMKSRTKHDLDPMPIDNKAIADANKTPKSPEL